MGQSETSRSEPLSAYVRRTRGDCDGAGPDWLADEIQVLEDALGWCHARQGIALPPPTREELLGDG
jgi:hypothetical protein